MTFRICGFCADCKAPMYMPNIWMGIYPPSPQPSCRCATQNGRTVRQPFPSIAPQSRDVGDEDAASVAELERQIVQDKILETRLEVEKIRSRQKFAESLMAPYANANDMSGVPSLHKALLTEDDLTSDEHPPVRYKKTDMDVRVDRLETMMVNLTVALGEVKKVLMNKINSDSDDGK